MPPEARRGSQADFCSDGTARTIGADEKAHTLFSQISEANAFPTLAEMERAIIVAAYERSNRKPLEAARLLGIGKTTVYRKLREMGEAAA